MKLLLSFFFSLTVISATAQEPLFIIHTLSLPEEISFHNNQLSGLYVYNTQLFLLGESRLQEGAEGKIYSIGLADIDKKLADTSYKLPWKKYHIYNLDSLRDKINAAGQQYEGLEAIIIDQNDIYLSVETTSESLNCYLLKGIVTDTSIVLNSNFLVPIPKFTTANGKPVYNAGFEGIAKMNDFFFAFYEFNYFAVANNVYVLDKFSFKGNNCLHTFPIHKLPFRLTDITYTGQNHFTAINYFYKGTGEDTVYRTPAGDSVNNQLITEKGGYKNYCRLIDIELKEDSFTWKPLWKFPVQYSDYNWEGIAAYKDGYFMMNDKYSPKPYQSTLLYLEMKKQP